MLTRFRASRQQRAMSVRLGASPSESQKSLVKPAAIKSRASSAAATSAPSSPSTTHPERQVSSFRTRKPSHDATTLPAFKRSHPPSGLITKPPLPRKSSARRSPNLHRRLSLKATVGSLLPNPGNRRESVQLHGGSATPSCSTTTRNTSCNVGKSAQMVFAVLTGITPATPPSTASEMSSLKARTALSFGKTVRALSTSKTDKAVAGVRSQGLITPSTPLEPVINNQNVQGSTATVPAVSSKSIIKLKKQLLDPQQARKIVLDLKRMELPPNLTAAGIDAATSNQLPSCTHLSSTRGYALAPLTIPTTGGAASNTAGTATASYTPNASTSDPPNPSPVSPSSTPYFVIPNPSTVAKELTRIAGPGAIEAAKEGAYELLADVSGAMVRRSGAQNGMKASFEGMSFFIYYWGFEITLPPPTMLSLSQFRNFQNTLFAVLQAFVIAGGAPELAPFIRYISMYMDTEWDGIARQDKGNGVVLAATWLLPIALVPRAWDFPLPSDDDPAPAAKTPVVEPVTQNEPMAPVLTSDKPSPVAAA
ncbi:hypothetical protein MVLG_00396 [Microbotryum lychnidis-dioicae p1A1 Lamole]|uniref:Uncharacterized protein n=1 Tax=Microbotryum lychnidis-dioicae (strain p1A1 Lamole / MvSl-1064) TaxID=683840 RepID=U5GYY7_USTV1|nr:hypothetical protein MVLG_00396 [Microbotryum lychnidis-dioicae p1A1 Lamole]|eukprot:KDE09496.1 hypothetical protein MVLG_00396 [Microbotryum lychnidis-dioicae p1A1 Lamole]